MRVLSTACPSCMTPLEIPLRSAMRTNTCPVCEARVVTHAFPALLRPATVAPRRDTAALTDESTCFNHAAKRAVAVCEDCGRFVCNLCDVPAPGAAKHQCVACFEQSLKREAGSGLSAGRTRMDDVALTAAVLGTLVFCAAPVTIPVVWYLILRYWREPQSVPPRSRWRFVVAGLLTLLSLAILAFQISAPIFINAMLGKGG
jgi:hypothetical protein